jgi:putative SOS response-associated peptidase YedK
MCGRFTQSVSWEETADFFDLDEVPGDVPPRYNVAPTQSAAVVRNEGARRLRMLRWGLIPSGAPDPSIGNRLINARSETANTLPSFRDAFRSRRCLVPVDGFFEWERLGRRRQPWLFRMREGGPFALAGLFEGWRAPPGFSAPWAPERGEPRVVETFTILTTDANDVVAPVHDRMPVILHPRAFDAWLDGGEVRLGPYPPGSMEAFRVRPLVNSPVHDDPRCVESLAGGEDRETGGRSPPSLFG